MAGRTAKTENDNNARILTQEEPRNKGKKLAIGRNHMELQRNLVTRNAREKENIGFGYGGGCLQIASINMDGFRTKVTQAT